MTSAPPIEKDMLPVSLRKRIHHGCSDVLALLALAIFMAALFLQGHLH